MKRIFVILIVLVLTLLVALPGMGVMAANQLVLSDKYLSSEAFTNYEWGPGSLDSAMDLKNPLDVGFALSGLTDQGTLIGDDFWGPPYSPQQLGPDPLSGLAMHSLHPTCSDGTAFDYIELWVENMGCDAVWVCVFMNTGFTGSGWSADSGKGPDDMALNTYWEGNWRKIGPGKEKTVRLNFHNATAYKVDDDPVYTGYAEGATGLDIWRLDEVTNIGIQVADRNYTTGPGTSTWLIVGGW